MNLARYKNIRTFNEIKLEKARLRYEMLVAENRLHENLEGVQRIITLGAIAPRITTGLHFVQNVYRRFAGFLSWFRRQKTQKQE